MHAENVRVRNNDAIIVDLANVRSGPLCADIASLECWLAFEVPNYLEQSPDLDTWRNAVRELFSPENIARPPGLASAEMSLDWLRACVRETRMIANTVCESDTEYATAIALHLLRRAQYVEDGDDEDAYRRAFGYFLGSQLVRWLTGKASADIEKA